MLNKRFGNIKGAVSDLHRDVTTRRCLTSYERVEDIVRECATIKTDLDRADNMMDDHKVEFEKRWQQEQLRIKTEQAVFNDQVFYKEYLPPPLMMTGSTKKYSPNFCDYHQNLGSTSFQSP